jgi:hypothetical protein
MIGRWAFPTAIIRHSKSLSVSSERAQIGRASGFATLYEASRVGIAMR